MKITAEELRAHFNYSPDTGIFTRKVARGKRWPAGAPSGWKMTLGYTALCVGGTVIYAHRAAWLYVHGEHPRHAIDHINGDRADNRIANLRDVPQAINGQNLRAAHVDNATGLLGVCLEKSSGRYVAQVRVAGKHWIKRFKTAEEAHAAYLERKRAMHKGCTV
jgi:hypothetical protein